MSRRILGFRTRRPVRTPRDPAYLRDLFTHSARYYDAVNALITFGRVRAWRADTVALARIREGDRVLDAFSGPGGLAEEAVRSMGERGELVLVDLSPVMLEQARRRVEARVGGRGRGGYRRAVPAVRYQPGDLLRQELGLGTFDVILLGWGLRYVPDVPSALTRLRRLLRPGGRLVVLEFTRPSSRSWAWPAQLYFRHVLPALAGRLAGDRELYEYLRSTSESFFEGDTLRRLAGAAGFSARIARVRLGRLVTTIVAEDPYAESTDTAIRQALIDPGDP